jgi:hypothetical protein
MRSIESAKLYHFLEDGMILFPSSSQAKRSITRMLDRSQFNDRVTVSSNAKRRV